jgi:hypothetical protein
LNGYTPLLTVGAEEGEIIGLAEAEDEDTSTRLGSGIEAEAITGEEVKETAGTPTLDTSLDETEATSDDFTVAGVVILIGIDVDAAEARFAEPTGFQCRL